MQPMLNIAIRAARSAGDHIVRKMNKLSDLQIEVKGPNDFVSEVDRQAEEKVIETLLSSYPEHGILAEESGEIKGGEDYRWIIDPLDGTTNYLHGFPHFAVSIACQHKDRLEHAVIYDPIKQEIFAASRGDGAILNNKRIRVSRIKSTQGALLGTGFPFKNHDQLDEFVKIFSEFFSTAVDIRRAGSAALDLAYVAAGRLDGFWESGLKPWDIAAGALIVREAGGITTDYEGNDKYLELGQVVSGNPKIMSEMLRKIQQCRLPMKV
ncbi:MAG: inositol monophosphatase family protein [Gammaproteobacteria bacterium]|nr:inositol monophosphatase family protein [Gammaproteobacteria bacterium]